MSDTALAESHRYLSSIGESAKNTLLLLDIQDILQRSGFIVTGNKSAIEGHALPLSICSSSRADLLAFNPHRHIMLHLEVQDQRATYDDDFIGETSEEVLVKGLQGLGTENKNKKVEASQQLYGGIEKELGEMGFKHIISNADDPIFYFVEIYALTIFNETNSCMVRKFDIDFINSSTTVICGDKELSKIDAVNRVIKKLM